MSTKITKIGITKDKISGRGGITFFLRYVDSLRMYNIIASIFSSLFIVGAKGLKLEQFLKQMFAFFIDGTDMSISGFDQKKKDSGYIAVLENAPEQMASSHQIKRFFAKISIVGNLFYNRILHELFVWRLKITTPTIVKIGVDTMVMDNDDSNKKEGNEPTYKRKKGFQPLHICWGPFLIDVLFRKGSAHSNHGTDYTDRVKSIVKLIRRRYSADVPIIICSDSGFADQKAFDSFDKLGVHFITTSKIYEDHREYIANVNTDIFGEYKRDKAIWKYFEFGNKLKSWNMFRRCIFTKPHCEENGQFVLDFNKVDNLIYTNIGQCEEADQKLREAGFLEYFEAETIIRESHARGADELVHRSVKELATKEQLPFKSFGMNKAYYLLLVICHFLFESYKQDVTNEVISPTVYPNTFRRRLIDFAVKVTSGSRYVFLRVSQAVFKDIEIELLWKKAQSPPPIYQFT